MIKITDTIKSIIKDKGFTQRFISEKTGIDEQRLSDMLNGRRRILATDIILLCEVLEVLPNKLLGYE